MSIVAGPRAESSKIIEPPRVLRERELLEVRDTVEAHNRGRPEVSPEDIAHARDPGAVDESEVNVRVGSESFDQLRRRAIERTGSGRSGAAPAATPTITREIAAKTYSGLVDIAFFQCGLASRRFALSLSRAPRAPRSA